MARGVGSFTVSSGMTCGRLGEMGCGTGFGTGVGVIGTAGVGICGTGVGGTVRGAVGTGSGTLSGSGSGRAGGVVLRASSFVMCLSASASLSWSLLSGDAGVGFLMAWRMSRQEAAMISSELAMGVLTCVGNHATVSVMRMPWVSVT